MAGLEGEGEISEALANICSRQQNVLPQCASIYMLPYYRMEKLNLEIGIEGKSQVEKVGKISSQLFFKTFLKPVAAKTFLKKTLLSFFFLQNQCFLVF